MVVPVRTDPEGKAGPTADQARARAWRRVSRGLYVPSSVDSEVPEQRIVEAAACLPAAYGGVTGWAALRWAGATWFDGRDRLGAPQPVTLSIMRTEIRSQPGIAVSAERLPPRDLTTVRGLATTSAVRAVCFEMRYCSDERRATVLLDMALMHDVVSTDEVAAYVETLNGWTGVAKCRAALAMCEENSWSAMETVMRLAWTLDAGLPRPLCNRPVFDLAGRHVGTPDLLDAHAGLVGEYDGIVHLDQRRRGKDIDKEATYRSLGLEHVTMAAGDVASPSTTVVPRILQARARALARRAEPRGWTVEPPRWWVDTSTVAARRGLSAEQRDRLLRYRAS
ncbi:hypothetical protein [Nocardioides flavescens]|uniref:Uncharacterized protein n=1 Tax=Nocardioides flavescens TaxID=2691959 RepID=A0A6L7F142_9ACTN|nr:hypothetical protein [Nocardioides flavescens]MXG90002.1 hypothetical protein [Nocardioides flavescens]